MNSPFQVISVEKPEESEAPEKILIKRGFYHFIIKLEDNLL